MRLSRWSNALYAAGSVSNVPPGSGGRAASHPRSENFDVTGTRGRCPSCPPTLVYVPFLEGKKLEKEETKKYCHLSTKNRYGLRFHSPEILCNHFVPANTTVVCTVPLPGGGVRGGAAGWGMDGTASVGNHSRFPLCLSCPGNQVPVYVAFWRPPR
ncbi:hypothetical protein LY76DRAFT_346566 [Colletotrichum caudatum]|nr:hypothetical protein LY76DRAFT_346566 [Colletotrichum caudatum]